MCSLFEEDLDFIKLKKTFFFLGSLSKNLVTVIKKRSFFNWKKTAMFFIGVEGV